MKTVISISNIAWEKSLDEEVAKTLQEFGVSCIDIAPGKYFSDFSKTTDTQIQVVRQKWADWGFSIIGMQSLLYGTQGLNVFGERNSQIAMLNHLQHVCHIGAQLGATKLVFGSPKNRDCSGLTGERVNEIALNFFSSLGKIAAEEGVTICLETNPICYGANFLTKTIDTYNFVKKLAHPNIRMQLDTGAIFLNQESIDVIEYVWELVGHIHISEPNLSPLGFEKVNHKIVGEKLLSLEISMPKTIEMLTKSETLRDIANAVKLTQQFYGDSYEQ